MHPVFWDGYHYFPNQEVNTVELYVDVSKDHFKLQPMILQDPPVYSGTQHINLTKLYFFSPFSVGKVSRCHKNHWGIWDKACVFRYRELGLLFIICPIWYFYKNQDYWFRQLFFWAHLLVCYSNLLLSPRFSPWRNK